MKNLEQYACSTKENFPDVCTQQANGSPGHHLPDGPQRLTCSWWEIDQNICGWNLAHYLHVLVSLSGISSPQSPNFVHVTNLFLSCKPGSVLNYSKKSSLSPPPLNVSITLSSLLPQPFAHLSVVFVQLVYFCLSVSLIFWPVGLLRAGATCLSPL